jgi:hypothetical protein
MHHGLHISGWECHYEIIHTATPIKRVFKKRTFLTAYANTKYVWSRRLPLDILSQTFSLPVSIKYIAIKNG